MAEGITSTERRLLWVTGLISLLTGLITASTQLFEQFGKAIGVFGSLRGWQLWAAVGLFVVAGTWLLTMSRRRRSILRRPDALRLDRSNPEHLIGRKEALETLSAKCRSEPLVFLVGESGAGKSALVQAGLVPRLHAAGGSALLPIYVDSLVGADWEQGPRRALNQAVRAVTSEVGCDGEAGDLGRVEERTGRVPLIILDQFDDYQARYRDKFLRARTWIEPPQLLKENAFWRDIAELLRLGKIHLLLVTRSDAAAGLASARFAPAVTFNLEPIGKQYVGQILDQLLAGEAAPAIEDPDYGWYRLRGRLSADLEQGGAVLPQQLKVVLLGLSTLPKGILTVAAYERVGGASGLEARFIEDRIARTARTYRIPEERIRSALLAMVDPSARKTIEVPQRVLADRLAAGDQLAPLLERLEDDEILRRRARQAKGASDWQLDHDYLARAVLKAEANANRWRRTLQQGSEALMQAEGSWSRQWRALLPPLVQARMIADRLRGQFRYGAFRGYAVKSAQRFAPAAAVLLLLAAAGAYQAGEMREARLRAEASPILNAFDTQPQLNSDEELALLQLTEAPDRLQRHVLRAFLGRDRAKSFFAQAPEILRAIVGTSPEVRDRTTELLRRLSREEEFEAVESRRALAAATHWLGRPETLGVEWWRLSFEYDRELPYAYFDGMAHVLATQPLDSKELDSIVATFARLIADSDLSENGTMFELAPRLLSHLPPSAKIEPERVEQLAASFLRAVDTAPDRGDAGRSEERRVLDSLVEGLTVLPASFAFSEEAAAQIRSRFEQLPESSRAGIDYVVILARLMSAPVMAAVSTAYEPEWTAEAVARFVAGANSYYPTLGLLSELPKGLPFTADQRQRLLERIALELPAKSAAPGEKPMPYISNTTELETLDRSLTLTAAERSLLVRPLRQAVLASLDDRERFADALARIAGLPASLSFAHDPDVRPRIAAAFLHHLAAAHGDYVAMRDIAEMLDGGSSALVLLPDEVNRAYSILLDEAEHDSSHAAAAMGSLIERYPMNAAQRDRLARWLRRQLADTRLLPSATSAAYNALLIGMELPSDVVLATRRQACGLAVPPSDPGVHYGRLILVHDIGAARNARIADTLRLFRTPFLSDEFETRLIRHLQALAGPGIGFSDRWKAIEWIETNTDLRKELRQRFDVQACVDGYPESWQAELRQGRSRGG